MARGKKHTAEQIVSRTTSARNKNSHNKLKNTASNSFQSHLHEM